jgi:hypothetical protein
MATMDIHPALAAYSIALRQAAEKYSYKPRRHEENEVIEDIRDGIYH